MKTLDLIQAVLKTLIILAISLIGVGSIEANAYTASGDGRYVYVDENMCMDIVTKTKIAKKISEARDLIREANACPVEQPHTPIVYCGDGIVNQYNEQCDDGNGISGDGCSITCEKEIMFADNFFPLIMPHSGSCYSWDTECYE